MGELQISELLIGMINPNNVGIAILLLAGVWYVRDQAKERDKAQERHDKQLEMLSSLDRSVNNSKGDPDPETRGISTRTLAAKSYKMMISVVDELRVHRTEDAVKHTQLLEEIRDSVKTSKKNKS